MWIGFLLAGQIFSAASNRSWTSGRSSLFSDRQLTNTEHMSVIVPAEPVELNSVTKIDIK
jgi:hypothetical protein